MPSETATPLDVNQNAEDSAIGFGIAGYGMVAVGHTEGIIDKRQRLEALSSRNEKVRSGDTRHLNLNLGAQGRLLDVSKIVTTDDYREVIAHPKVQAVIVCLTTNFHREAALAVAGAGKHLFLEKPVGTNASEADEILAAFTGTPHKIAVNQILASFPEFEELLRELRATKIQDIQRLEMQRYVPWAATDDEDATRKACGWATDLGVHDANLIVQGLGDPESVTATGEMLYDSAQLLKMKLTFPGTDAEIVCNVGASKAHAGFHHSYALTKKDGSGLFFNEKGLARIDTQGTRRPVIYRSANAGQVFGHAIATAATYFRGESPDAGHLDAAKAVKTQKILKAATEAVKSGGSQRIEY